MFVLMLRSSFSKVLRITSSYSKRSKWIPSISLLPPLNAAVVHPNFLPYYNQKRYINIKKELKETHCCYGCGVQLQYTNEHEYGYIPRDTMISFLESKEKPICQRCHRVGNDIGIYMYSYVIMERLNKMKYQHPFLKRLSVKYLSKSIRLFFLYVMQWISL